MVVAVDEGADHGSGLVEGLESSRQTQRCLSLENQDSMSRWSSDPGQSCVVEAREQLAEVVDRLARPAPKVAWLAFYAFPAEHWSKLRSTNPLKRVNREIRLLEDAEPDFPDDAASLRLAGALLLEQNEEWFVGRRYLSQESLSSLLERDTPPDQGEEENPAQLQAART